MLSAEHCWLSAEHCYRKYHLLYQWNLRKAIR
jgi:hypothetical protein